MTLLSSATSNTGVLLTVYLQTKQYVQDLLNHIIFFSTFITAGSAPQGTADRPAYTVQTLLDKLLVRDQSNIVSIVT